MFSVTDSCEQQHKIKANTFVVEDLYVVFYESSTKVAMFYQPIAVVQDS